MGRNIKTLFNFEPPATENDIHTLFPACAMSVSRAARGSSTNSAIGNARADEGAVRRRAMVLPTGLVR